MNVVHFVNSFVDRPGNIGVRAGFLFKYLNKNKFVCFCRGKKNKIKNVNFITMGIFGHLPRVLNGIRIHLFKNYNHKLHDLKIFEIFCNIYFYKIKKHPKAGIAHIWDISPSLINKCKKNGQLVILDIPIAPSSYIKRLHAENKVMYLDYNKDIDKRERLSFELADHIISPSRFVLNELKKIGVPSEKITVNEFGVDLPKGIALKQYNEKSNLDFCFLGAANGRKGLYELLEVWDSKAFINDKLHLCGKIHPSAKSHIKKVSSGEIITPGFIKPFNYLKNCDVLVLPSWLEGSSKAVYEAMAMGLPVIVSKSTGSIVRDGIDGFLINAGDEKALSDKMLWFKNNNKMIKFMGENASLNVKKYTWERYAKGVQNCYSKLILDE